jgi:hypothetical protein
MKIRLAGSELSHADGQTDTTILVVAFRNFANAPKKLQKCSWVCFCALIYVPVVIHGGSGTWCLISAFTGVVTDTVCCCGYTCLS